MKRHREADPAFLAAWTRYFAGHWSKTPPTDDGIYPVIVPDYEPQQSTAHVYVNFLGKLYCVNREMGNGFLADIAERFLCWWSEPIPQHQLPDVPAKMLDDALA